MKLKSANFFLQEKFFINLDFKKEKIKKGWADRPHPYSGKQK
jgi:hypothetical protein